jgi:hypothetical protein
LRSTHHLVSGVIPCGVPTISSRGSSLEENLAGAAELVPPGDEEALTEAMRRLLCHEDLREQKVQMGLARSAQFQWMRTAREILDCYYELMSRDGGQDLSGHAVQRRRGRVESPPALPLRDSGQER